MQQDTYRHKGMRRRLVALLQEQGINNKAVLAAIAKVPRHFFFEKAFVEKAYENRAFPIGEGQTISQPYTVAHQTELLNVQKGDKILEIGTGSGYQACILAELNARIVTIERHQKLYQKTKSLLNKLDYPAIIMLHGDGYLGAPPSYGPFDKIIVTAAAPYIPPTLLDQLKVGGIMVVPVGDKRGQTMTRIIKTDQLELIIERGRKFMFVPMVKGRA